MPSLSRLSDVDAAAVVTRPLGKRIPNQFPSLPPDGYRLAVVGEAPGADEEIKGIPFIGSSGRLLDILLEKSGIDRRRCFVGNICQIRPPNNELDAFGWNSFEVQEGLEQLQHDLSIFKPNLILCLGKWSLKAFCGEWRSVESWRGSLLAAWKNAPLAGAKTMCSWHPAACLRVYEWTPQLRFDLKKAAYQAKFKELRLPVRKIDRGWTHTQIIDQFKRWLQRADEGHIIDLSFDLEGWWNRITRFAISEHAAHALVVPFADDAKDYGSCWSPEQEADIWYWFDLLARHPKITWVLQNGLYDAFVLAYRYRVLLCNIKYDTMIGHHELYCELPKNLGFQASIYTNEPYWKEEREDENLVTREIYCGKDAAVTKEIKHVQLREMSEAMCDQPVGHETWRPKEHFDFNMRLLRALLYMELRGLNYDSDAAKTALAEKERELYAAQHDFNIRSGRSLPPSKAAIFELAKSKCCKKREAPYTITFAQLARNCLKDWIPACNRLAELESAGLLPEDSLVDDATLGECEYLLEAGFNVESNKQMVDFLYVKCGYPRQWKEGKKGNPPTLTADVNALLTLYIKIGDDRLKSILKIRSLEYLCGTLRIKTDEDGRVRCGYNLVGTETLRLSCSESPTGSGYNLQTVTKKLRYLFRADDGHWFFQCDLAGADGWTVAAWCNALGDSTMIEDYRYGLKPAKIIALMYEHGDRINSLSRPELKAFCDSESREGGLCDGDGWLYFGSKRVQHSGNYGAGDETTSKIILKDSHKFTGNPIYIEPKIIGRLRAMYRARYWGLPKWHELVTTKLLSFGYLDTPCGHRRTFFGRIREGASGKIINHETLRAALSHEPQVNTTFATNRAMFNLWSDPENRRPNGSLIIEPLHQVHDALCGQFPKELAEWAVPKIASYFGQSMCIAGQEIVIPFEGAYGPNWKDLNVGKI